MSNDVRHAARGGVIGRLAGAFAGPGLAQRPAGRRSGDAAAASFELVATTAIFAVLGYLLDLGLGTQLVFTVAFGVIALSYEVWRLCTNYNAEMDALASDLPGGDRYQRNGQGQDRHRDG